MNQTDVRATHTNREAKARTWEGGRETIKRAPRARHAAQQHVPNDEGVEPTAKEPPAATAQPPPKGPAEECQTAVERRNHEAASPAHAQRAHPGEPPPYW